MIAGGAFLYFTIERVIYKQIDNSLITEKTIIQNQIEQTDTIPDFEATDGNQIEVKLLNYPVRKFQSIKDTDIYDTGLTRIRLSDICFHQAILLPGKVI